MKTLYLDCSMGAAGDMLTAALSELLEDKAPFFERLDSLLPQRVKVSAETVIRQGISGTSVTVLAGGEEEHSEDAHGHHHHHHDDHEHHDDDHHGHGHHHHHHDDDHHGHEHHHHASMQDIEDIITGLDVPEKVKKDAVAVYKLIAEAESAAHGRPVSEIHFHEVGTLDAVADVTAVCLLMDMLKPERVIASPVCVGYGHVHCAHGILPVPAPATAHILRGVPTYSGSIESELCTPTGAALLKYFVTEYGDMPVLTAERIGYGFGKKELPRLNCVRAFLGESGEETGDVAELCCNIDDMTGEALAAAERRLYSLGALEVFTTPVNMKKGRAGVLMTCLCPADKRAAFAEAILRNTTTIGVRERLCKRYTLSRREETVSTRFGEIRVKVSEGCGITRIKPEADDIEQAADRSGVTFEEVRAEAMNNYSRKFSKN